MVDEPLQSQIRAAVLAELEPLGFAVGGYLQAIATIGQPITGENEMAHLMAVLNGRAPAVLIAIGDEAISNAEMASPMRRWQSDFKIHAYLIGTSHRSREAGRLTADVGSMLTPGYDPGLDVMARDVELLLAGFKPEIAGAGPFKPFRHGHIFLDADGTIREYVFQLTVNRKLAALDPKRRINFITEIQGRFTPAAINEPAIVVETLTKAD